MLYLSEKFLAQTQYRTLKHRLSRELKAIKDADDAIKVCKYNAKLKGKYYMDVCGVKIAAYNKHKNRIITLKGKMRDIRVSHPKVKP